MDSREEIILIFNALMKALGDVAEENKLDAGNILQATSAFHTSISNVLVNNKSINWTDAVVSSLKGVQRATAATEKVATENTRFTYPMPGGSA